MSCSSKRNSKFQDEDAEENMRVIADTPYIYMEFPGDNTRRGRQYDSYVCYPDMSKCGGGGGGNKGGKGKGTDGGKGTGDKTRFEMHTLLNLPREIVCEALDCPAEMSDWRNCQKSGEEEKTLTLQLREVFKGYVPKL